MAEYLEREKVFFALEELRMMETMSKHATYKSCAIARDAMEKMQIVVVGLPIADVAPVVHGRFVHDGPRFAGGVDWWHCSNCGGLASGAETRFDYCPWCGAKMDEGKNDAPN